jgi:hypothetical protein
VKVWLEFSGLALIILLPLLLPGYILTLDLVFAPHVPAPDITASSFLLEGILWLLYRVLPGDIVEKLVLFGSLLIAGVGMYAFIQVLPRPQVTTYTWRLMSYIAGIFYTVNPFIYARIMAGQWMIVLGYALLPFFLVSIIQFLRSPSLKTSLIVAAWMIAISTVSLHYIGIAFILGIICVMLFSKRTLLAAYSKWGAVAFGVWMTANLYWIVPLLVGNNEAAQSISHFDESHFTAFETVGGVLSVLQLQGFWVEARQLFLLPQKIMPLWGLFIILLWALVVYGTVKAWQSKHKRIVIMSSTSIVLGILLAASPIVEWMSQYIPFMAGYREPHKLTTLVVVGYCVLLACGGAYVLEKLKRKSSKLRDGTIIGLFLLPILITPTMLGGFAGQLVPRSYPPEWYEVNIMLKQDPHVRRVLFLPWHQYANYSFSGRIIANPAQKFFEVPVIISDDPDFKNISPTLPNKEKEQLTQVLAARQLPLQLLKKTNITHVMLAKEQDWDSYKTILTSAAFVSYYENDKLLLYKVKYDTKQK